jgi:hypothetical protein
VVTTTRTATVKARRARGCVALVVVLALCALTSGCGWSPTGKASYHPPFTPIEISVNTEGKVTFSAGTEWVTPIGTFGIGADVDPPPDDKTLLAISHRGPGGRPVQDRYTISSTQTIGVCFNGSAYGEFGDHRIFLNAFDAASTIEVVASGTQCPRPPQQRVQPEAAASQGGYKIARVQVGGVRLTVLLADTPEKIAHGMPGITAAQLGRVDGMLYTLPAPQSFDPATGNGAFVFPGYRFAPEVHFFDANGQYWAGGPVQVCAADRHDCHPYYAELYGVPVPYQYVLELVYGRLGPVAPGTPLIAA